MSSVSLQKKAKIARRLPTWVVVGMHGVLFCVLVSSFLTKAHISPINGDLRGYIDIARDILTVTRGPWISFYSFYFYPPLANILFLIVHFNTFNFLTYDTGLFLTMIIFGIGAVLFIYDTLEPRDFRWLFLAIFVSVALLEPSTFFARYDFFPTVTLLLSALCLRRKKAGWAGFMLGISFMLKFAPIFLIPLGFVLSERGKGHRFIVGFLIACLSTWILYDFLIGWGATYDVFRGFFEFRKEQLVYIFSTTGSIDFAVKKILGARATVVWLDPNLGHFVDDFPGFFPLLLQVLSIVGSLIIAVIALRDTNRLNNILLYFGASIFWILSTTSFCNNHYYLWCLPFVYLWFLESSESETGISRRHILIALIASFVALLGQFQFPYGYYMLIFDQSWIAVLGNLIRNLLVFTLSILCLEASAATKETSS